MKTYIGIADQSGNSAFGIWFPDVPGCFSASDEESAIVRNAIEALSLHLDGEELPEARTGAQLKDEPEVAAALREGAWMLGIPFIGVPHTRSVKANISLDRGMLLAIDAVAAERGLTRSAFLVEAARREIERG